jgi:heavy metal translocating P-type ATPase
MDTLIGVGAGAAYFYSTIIMLFPSLRASLGLSEMYFFDVTVIVVVLVYLGKYLESLAKLKTGSVLQKLMNLQSKEALIDRNGEEIKVPVKDLKLGDIMLVKTGEKIPSDGIISEGSALVDESLISGESLPINKKMGEQVIGSTINRQGYIKVKVERVGEDTFLANIISAVEEAQNSKAPIQKIADKVSGVFVPIILALSVLVLFAWLIIGPRFLPQSEVISVAITTFVSILAIACPCALGLATPTGIMVGLGIASKRGILIKNAEILEKLGKTNTIVFDKTGTITKGEVVLSEIESDLNEDEFLSISASLEKKSNHPLAKAITDAAKNKNIKTEEVTNFNEEAGLGISGKIEGKKYYLGNDKFMFNLGIKNTPESAVRMEKEGKTTIYLAVEKDNKKEVIGHLAVSDVIKEDAFKIISSLKKMGIKTIMLSGDKENTAKYIAKQAGIDEVIAEVSPLEKAEKIKSLKNEGQIITMVGDGINDAVALAASDIGLAMSNGSDIAIESADVTILNGELAKIIQAIKVSRLTLKKIKQNLFWAFFYNIIAIPIAAGAFYLSKGILLSPIVAAGAMSLSSLSVIFNTLTMKKARI